jgi:hypothetical protein
VVDETAFALEELDEVRRDEDVVLDEQDAERIHDAMVPCARDRGDVRRAIRRGFDALSTILAAAVQRSMVRPRERLAVKHHDLDPRPP